MPAPWDIAVGRASGASSRAYEAPTRRLFG